MTLKHFANSHSCCRSFECFPSLKYNVIYFTWPIRSILQSVMNYTIGACSQKPMGLLLSLSITLLWSSSKANKLKGWTFGGKMMCSVSLGHLQQPWSRLTSSSTSCVLCPGRICNNPISSFTCQVSKFSIQIVEFCSLCISLMWGPCVYFHVHNQHLISFTMFKFYKLHLANWVVIYISFPTRFVPSTWPGCASGIFCIMFTEFFQEEEHRKNMTTEAFDASRVATLCTNNLAIPQK